MAQVETNRAKIVKRLIAEGWQNVGGGAHYKFVKPGRQSIMVPRHRTVTPGVARTIAKGAGWI